MSECVQLEVLEEGIAIITLDRQEAANSFSIQLLTELNDILAQLRNQPTIRVVVVTGAGDKVFCAGADLKERQGMSAQQVKQVVSMIGSTVRQVEALPQPILAAINGVAVGGGLELALACDIRIASEQAKMGLTETSLGIIPGAGGTQRLPRLIGLGRAKELIYTARRISATEAYKYGLVEYVVPQAHLLDHALNIAVEIAKNAPLSLVQAKVAINQGVEVDLLTGLKIEELAYKELLHTGDRLEGLRAFQEKRKPQYTGQ